MSRGVPVWKLMGMPEQPPADDNDMIDYGTVWSADTHVPMTLRQKVRWDLSMGWLSYKMWGTKIVKQQRWNWQRIWRPWLVQRFAAWYVAPLTRAGEQGS